jgi:hypothetical protein
VTCYHFNVAVTDVSMSKSGYNIQSFVAVMMVDVALTNHPRLLALLRDNGAIFTCLNLGHS